MKYSNILPKIIYNNIEVVNIFRNININGDIENHTRFYRIIEGDTLLHIAHKLYKNKDYFWLITNINDIKDIIFDIALDTNELSYVSDYEVKSFIIQRKLHEKDVNFFKGMLYPIPNNTEQIYDKYRVNVVCDFFVEKYTQDESYKIIIQESTFYDEYKKVLDDLSFPLVPTIQQYESRFIDVVQKKLKDRVFEIFGVDFDNESDEFLEKYMITLLQENSITSYHDIIAKYGENIDKMDWYMQEYILNYDIKEGQNNKKRIIRVIAPEFIRDVIRTAQRDLIQW